MAANHHRPHHIAGGRNEVAAEFDYGAQDDDDEDEDEEEEESEDYDPELSQPMNMASATR